MVYLPIRFQKLFPILLKTFNTTAYKFFSQSSNSHKNDPDVLHSYRSTTFDSMSR